MTQLIFAGTAALGTLAMLALFDAARPDTTQTVLGSGSVRLTGMALPAPVGGPFGPQLPQTPPNLVGGGFAADNDDDQAQQQAQLQEQFALQQMQQSQQLAEEQNERPSSNSNKACSRLKWMSSRPTTLSTVSKRDGRAMRPLRV
jgi:hypothetical protein